MVDLVTPETKCGLEMVINTRKTMDLRKTHLGLFKNL